MPLQHAMLALLTERDSYGYELKSRFESVIGPQWGSLNIGHVYQILDRLVRDEYATRARIEQDTRPDKNLYQITDSGRAELDEWLANAHVRTGGYRDELILKLFAAARLGGDTLTTVVTAQREAYLGELAVLGELRRAHKDDALVSLLLHSAVLHTQADLKITEAAETRLAGYKEQPAEEARPTAGRVRRARGA